MSFSWTNELCQTCGTCCFVAHGVPVNNLVQIAEVVDRSPEKLFDMEAVEQVGKAVPILNTRSHGRCVFLSRKEGKHACEEQEVKPATCKTYRCWLLGSVEEFANLGGEVLRSNPFFGLKEEEIQARAFSFVPVMRAALLWDWWWSGSQDAVTPASIAAMNSVGDFPAIAGREV